MHAVVIVQEASEEANAIQLVPARWNDRSIDLKVGVGEERCNEEKNGPVRGPSFLRLVEWRESNPTTSPVLKSVNVGATLPLPPSLPLSIATNAD
jgi:hypothetical protein